MDEDWRGFHVIDWGGDPVPTYPEGRRCSVCDERLSVYNPGPLCYHCDAVRAQREAEMSALLAMRLSTRSEAAEILAVVETIWPSPEAMLEDTGLSKEAWDRAMAGRPSSAFTRVLNSAVEREWREYVRLRHPLPRESEVGLELPMLLDRVENQRARRRAKTQAAEAARQELLRA